MNPIALITGATAGIGRATALLLAKNDFDIIVTGRRVEQLEALEEEIRSRTSADVITLAFDIRNHDRVREAYGRLSGKWQQVDVLVNNAGLAAGLARIHQGNPEDWEQMIDTNIKGLLYITRLVSPGMVERKKGHIINIGSIAGKQAYESGNVYNATKFAVDGLTRAMRIDLVEYGIRVTAIHPGAVETEFSMVRFKGNREQAEKVYKGFTPLYAEDIAEAVLFAVTRPPHVNVDDMLIMSTAQASATHIHKEE
ncbi:MAG: SDR family NAD(P)-dependent oxidoreductase [Bacteroidales bacterium]